MSAVYYYYHVSLPQMLLVFPCVAAQALGLKPKSAPSTRSQPALEKHEVERLLKGGGDEQDAAPAGAAAEADRIKGLGFQSGYALLR